MFTTNNGYSLSDIAAANGGGGGFGGTNGGAWWIIILFLFCFMGGNGFGNNNSNALEQQDLQRAIDLNSLQNGQRDIEAGVQRSTQETISAVKDVAYNNLSEIRDNGAYNATGFANVQSALATGFSEQQKHCCETMRAIDGVNYNSAINTASINANTTAQTQKILDALAADKISNLQAQVSELKTQNMFCGIPRINPYGYGVYPYNIPNPGNYSGLYNS